MNIKFRLILMNFMQYFVWGAWLLTIGHYWFDNNLGTATQFSAIFSTMGISAIFMPAITGIIVDRYVNAEKLYGLMHILGAVVLFCLPLVKDPTLFFWVMLLNMVFYMPTISLSITVAYSAMKKNNIDIVKNYPPIRTWGTVGFIAALWTVSLTKNESSPNQFYIASAVALILGIYSFNLPKCPPLFKKTGKKSFVDALGLNAFTLFKTPRFAIFFIFSMLLGAALQLTNAYGDVFPLLQVVFGRGALQIFNAVEPHFDKPGIRFVNDVFDDSLQHHGKANDSRCRQYFVSRAHKALRWAADAVVFQNVPCFMLRRVPAPRQQLQAG